MAHKNHTHFLSFGRNQLPGMETTTHLIFKFHLTSGSHGTIKNTTMNAAPSQKV
jgi:hypothetical protein